MGVSMGDRVISVLSYCTFAIFSIIWLIFANMTRRKITPYLSFNMYQAIFISMFLAALSLVYSIAINLLSVVPVIGTFAKAFDIFFNQTPLYFSYTVSGLIVSILLLYLSIICILGRRPYIPLISDTINSNFGG